MPGREGQVGEELLSRTMNGWTQAQAQTQAHCAHLSTLGARAGDRGSEETEGARRRRQQARPQRGGEEEQGGTDVDYV